MSCGTQGQGSASASAMPVIGLPAVGFAFPGLDQLLALLKDTPFEGLKSKIDGEVVALKGVLEKAEILAWLVPGLKPQLDSWIKLLKVIDTALDKIP